MQRILQAIINNGEDVELMCGIVNALVRVACDICGGVGHSATRCSAKRSLDRTFRAMDLGMAWGRVKSSIMVEGMARRRVQNRELRRIMRDEAAAWLAQQQAVAEARLREQQAQQQVLFEAREAEEARARQQAQHQAQQQQRAQQRGQQAQQNQANGV